MSTEKRNIVEPNKCPECGKEFSCSKSSKCWCFEYDVPADVLERIQEKYDGCLCKDCLLKVSNL